MFSEVVKTAETHSESKLTDALKPIDISKRIDVNRSSDESQKGDIDINKRIQPNDALIDGTQTRNELEPRSEKHDGQKYYYDDNGNIYRVDDNLLPNTTYEINNYKYETDDQGRISSASGVLRLQEPERDRLNIRDDMETIGKGDQKKSDDRGHLIADRFDGTNGLENMVPQDASINRGKYEKFEQELSSYVNDGKTVSVDVRPVYSDDSRRPTAISVTYSIDGEMGTRIFPNSQEKMK